MKETMNMLKKIYHPISQSIIYELGIETTQKLLTIISKTPHINNFKYTKILLQIKIMTKNNFTYLIFLSKNELFDIVSENITDQIYYIPL